MISRSRAIALEVALLCIPQLAFAAAPDDGAPMLDVDDGEVSADPGTVEEAELYLELEEMLELGEMVADEEPAFELPTRQCTRYHLKMTMIDLEFFLRDLNGYDISNGNTDPEHVNGYLEYATTWVSILRRDENLGPNNETLNELRDALADALYYARLADSARGVWQEYDKDELVERLPHIACTIAAARDALARARALLDLIPIKLKEKNAEVVQLFGWLQDGRPYGDIAEAQYLLAYAAAIVENQQTACDP